jgi:transcriptional regulator with PAS, ATPase and Fis domain
MRRRIDVSLAVLVPLILGGVAVLAVLSADSLAGRFPRFSTLEPAVAMALAAGVSVGCVSAAFVFAALRPIRRLLRTTAPALPLAAGPAKAAGLDDFGRLGVVADQMAEVLGALDARALFPNMVGESRAMRAVFAQVLKVAASDASVLLLGESGTGKDLAARGIHDKSPRSAGAFVAVNCAAIPQGLLESELFGHEKGAFTGAVARRVGRFEQAAGGTLFLDEIGDMPPEIQAKILRVLETRQFERVGGTTTLRADVRVIAATHRDLGEMIRRGAFREDLFHRLNVFPVHLPPLRERREDIALLAGRFLETLQPGVTLSLAAMQRLLAHDWPGNVRELRNTLERAALLAGDAAVLEPRHLPALAETGPGEAVQAGADDLDSRLAAYERSLIEAALARTGGVQARAATLLGIKERSLWHRVKKLGISPGLFRPAGQQASNPDG